MSKPSTPTAGAALASAIILGLGGWLGLYLLMTKAWPTLGPRWLFFFLWFLATSGTAMPFIWLLHRRFGAENPLSSRVLLRRSLWVGLFAAFCAWLQINRSLTLPLVLLLAAGLAGLEALVRVLERSSWRPRE